MSSPRPIVLCILDGVGWGRRDDGDAVWLARMPHLNRMLATRPWCLLRAHGTAVGMPSDEDMGNSEVGHNAMGAGRVFDQGAKLIDAAIHSGAVWRSPTWARAIAAEAAGGTLHLIGLLSDGGVHSNVSHLRALLRRAHAEGVRRLRLHILTDGRDVAARSALDWVRPLEGELADYGAGWAIGTGGGRMHLTMDRYEADWAMVERGWRCHVGGEGRRFPSASAAIETLYAEAPTIDDQWLPSFVVGDYTGMADGDAALLFNFRGDRAIEISRAFDEGPDFDTNCFGRAPHPSVIFGGMMEYDGDRHIPAHYLVEPPAIDGTVGQALAAAGRRVLAISETQKFGHVTYFFNGNRSGALAGEDQVEIPSDRLPFDQAPAMKAREIVARVKLALKSGHFDHIRLNLANGDMVGHTGKRAAAVAALEVVDECLGELEAAVLEAGGVLLVTADHGNADEMWMLDRKKGRYQADADGYPKPCTSHSLNPVPFIVVEAEARHALREGGPGVIGGGIAQIGATLLELCEVPVPPDYLPSLILSAPRRSPSEEPPCAS
jgi:2,3-bisphosphoglycerate-independent phosphoglycerate mutase